MIRSFLFITFASLFVCETARADTFYSDPLKGAATNKGTKAEPWPALDKIVSQRLIAKLSAGDTLFLMSGYHGKVILKGDNKAMVSIAGAEGETPQIGRLSVTGSNWTIRGLAIGPKSNDIGYPGYIATLGESGQSSNLVLEDCYVFSTEDNKAWGINDWMEAPNGVLLGRNGTKLVARNNYVSNTRFGIVITSSDSLCEGNVVTDFSADGLRVTKDNITVSYNVIKNVYITDADGDKNHDDAIQCFLFNNGTGTVRNVTIDHNFAIMQEDDNQKFPAPFQGIGFFDGPLVGFNVTDNFIATQTYHGISLYNAIKCKILRNVVYSPWNGKLKPWIMLGDKAKVGERPSDNEVHENYAHLFNLRSDTSVKESQNNPVTAAIATKRAAELLEEIDHKFGKTHPVANKPRADIELIKKKLSGEN